ncbi:MAG: 50S ribosomal protein L13 [Patescibacteria group bacterium]
MKKKTYLPTVDAVQTFDARGKVLGRLATQIATVLRGKDKPTFAPHRIEGDRVIVIHSRDVSVTGKKLDQKIYRTHSGYLGNMKEVTLKQLMLDKPAMVLEMAIYNMLPKNRLRRELMRRLTIYPDEIDAKKTKNERQPA